MTARRIRTFVKRLGYVMARLADYGLPEDHVDLAGDRDVEWAWVNAHLPEQPGRVLDFGPATSSLALTAAFKGGAVVGLDLNKYERPYLHPNLTFAIGDLTEYDLGPARFDTIINCSTIEHVGLVGRYGSKPDPDGDLKAMAILKSLMAGPQSRMILTIPVGQDAVYAPYHRIYGVTRLPRLLEGLRPLHEAYYAKISDNRWRAVDQTEALSTQASASFYALGLFVLTLR